MKSHTDVYGQQWFLVDRFELGLDLSAVSGWLRQQGVVHQIVEEGGAQALWIANPVLAEQVTDFIAHWRQGDIDISRSGPAPAASGPSRMAQWLQSLTRIPVTWSLLLLCLPGYLAVVLVNQLPLYEWMTFVNVDWRFRGPMDSFSLPLDQPWRFLTPMFLHYGYLHILGNGVFLWYLGSRIERVDGSRLFLLMALVVAAGANIGQYAWEHNPNFGGMSGVNYGLIGYIIVRQLLAPHRLLAVPKGLLGFTVVMMVLSMFGVVDIFIDGAVANAAHVTGFMLGLTWGFFYSSRPGQG